METNAGCWFARFTVGKNALWDAWTDKQKLGAWFDPGAELQPRVGGKLSAPGNTQFRGMSGDIVVEQIKVGSSIQFSWPLNGIRTRVTLTFSDCGNGSKLEVHHLVLESREIFPPRSNEGTLKHYWKQTLASLKYFLELGKHVDRRPLAGRNLKEVELANTFCRPVGDVWKALTVPSEMDKWLSKRAEVDLRLGGRITYGWDHGADRITRLEPESAIAYTWANDEDVSTVSWSLKERGIGQTEVVFRQFGFSGVAPQRATSYNEGWFTFLLILGLFLEKELKTLEWSNLNEDPNS